MATYTPDQLARYFERIQWPQQPTPGTTPTLKYLTKLQTLHLANVPFETLGLHYSVDKRLTLDPEALFEKIVARRRGGYCLELNTFFAAILRSLGFRVFGVVCRISMRSRGVHDGSWRGMSHMALIVTLPSSGKKYFVDVGYGSAEGPCRPIPLESGAIVPGLPGRELRLEWKKLPQHESADQRVWVYAQRVEGGEWFEVYHFTDSEFFTADFEILNEWNMTMGGWTKRVYAQKFIGDDDDGEGGLLGSVELLGGTIVGRRPMGEVMSMQLEGEEERLKELKRLFGIELTGEEKEAIHGTEYALARQADM